MTIQEAMSSEKKMRRLEATDSCLSAWHDKYSSYIYSYEEIMATDWEVLVCEEHQTTCNNTIMTHWCYECKKSKGEKQQPECNHIYGILSICTLCGVSVWDTVNKGNQKPQLDSCVAAAKKNLDKIERECVCGGAKTSGSHSSWCTIKEAT